MSRGKWISAARRGTWCKIQTTVDRFITHINNNGIVLEQWRSDQKNTESRSSEISKPSDSEGALLAQRLHIRLEVLCSAAAIAGAAHSCQTPSAATVPAARSRSHRVGINLARFRGHAARV